MNDILNLIVISYESFPVKKYNIYNIVVFYKINIQQVQISEFYKAQEFSIISKKIIYEVNSFFWIQFNNINFLTLRFILLFCQIHCGITPSGVVGENLSNFAHTSKTLFQNGLKLYSDFRRPSLGKYRILSPPKPSSVSSNRFFQDAIWAPSSEFVSSSIPSWQILTAHAQPFRRARDLAFCLKVPLDSLLVWASSRGSGETARMRRLAWTFAARTGDNYQIRLTRPI